MFDMQTVINKVIYQTWNYPSDNLPDENVPVLIFVPEADLKVWVASYQGFGWVYEGESDAIDLEIVAWTYIPTAPITKKEADATRNAPEATDKQLADFYRETKAKQESRGPDN